MINLDAYLARIGYSGAVAPTLDALNAIVSAHVRTIPFENLDVLLGRPIVLTPEALEQKLVTERRGGYCFEQNGLLLEVLNSRWHDLQNEVGSAQVVGDTLEERLESVLEVLSSHYGRPAQLAHLQILLDLGHDPRTSEAARKAVAVHHDLRRQSPAIVRGSHRRAIGADGVKHREIPCLNPLDLPASGKGIAGFADRAADR